MAVDQAFVGYILDQLHWLGPVSSRRMFGGTGLFLDGLMFGLVMNNSLYLKANVETRTRYEAMGCGPMSYERKGKTIALSYYQLPEEVLDDREQLVDWANEAYAVALAAAK